MIDFSIDELIKEKQFVTVLKFIQTKGVKDANVSSQQAGALIRGLSSMGKLKEGMEFAESFLETYADDSEILFLLGNMALKVGDVDKAIPPLERANILTPNQPVILANLSVGYNSIDKHGDAVRCLQQAARVNPRYSFAYQKMGSIQCKAGQVKEGMRSFQRAMMLSPKPNAIYARMLFWKNYLAESKPDTIYAESKVWGQQFTHNFEKGIGVYLNSMGHQKKLKVGFVSPDYCAHPVSFFVEPLFKNLDRDKFEVYAYSDVPKPDKVTEQIKGQVDVFKSIAGVHSQTVARTIINDGIDVLFDLAGHTGDGRLDMFHMRPAPVQISWLGYPATTGSAGIDYRFSDRYADPASKSDPFHTETLLRVDGGFLCYVPSERTPDASTKAPRVANGHITFGSFNNLAKVSEQCIEMWAEILHQVKGSVLMMKRRELKDPWVKKYFVERFAAYGIDKSRLVFKTSQTTLEGHLRNYSNVDIALDSFPYNGTTTTFEALWMNVPVISLGGDTHASRVGQSILRYAGLKELAAVNRKQYIDKAVKLANDKKQLNAYRKSLRNTLGQSSLTNQQRFVRNVSRIIRQRWIAWCKQQQEDKKVIMEDEA